MGQSLYRYRHVNLSAGLVFLIGSTALAQRGAERSESATVMWSNRCAECHGKGGEGVSGKAGTLLTDAAMSQDKDRPYFDVLRKAQGPHVVSAGLSEQQTWAVIVHLREMQERDWRRRGGPGTGPKAKGGVYTTLHAAYTVETVVDKGLRTPWAIDWQPGTGGRRALVTEKDGELSVVEGGQVIGTVLDLPAMVSNGQGGLMDVAFHPAFEKNRFVYLAFAESSGPTATGGRRGREMTKVVRGTLEESAGTDGKPNVWRFSNHTTIFAANQDHYAGPGVHYGARIVFQTPPAADAALVAEAKGRQIVYFCIGERGGGELAQQLDRPHGKVFRVFEDGQIPSSNPYADGSNGAYAATWTYGHRNQQGMCFDDAGNLWVTEHGPRGGDELNLLKRGANYGWPQSSYGIHYSDQPFVTPWAESAKNGDAIVKPVYRWLPSIAACGLDCAREAVVKSTFPGWSGDLFAGGLAKQTVQRVRVKDGQPSEVEEIFSGMGRVRDVAFGPDAYLYIVLNGPDKVVRLVPAK